MDDPILLVTEAAEAVRLGAAEVGGKAVNLARLAGSGLAVPPWYVVPAAASAAALAAAGLDRWIAERLRGLDDPAGAAAAGEEVRRRILALDVPAGLAAAVAAEQPRIAGGGGLVAVRSSAAGEDAADDSFAGVHDSFLFVRGSAAVAAAVRAVWASAYSERALAYRLRRGLPLTPVAMAVVVQRMVEAAASGVLFTADPATGDVHQQVVSALWGAGEGLVSAGLEADTWVVQKPVPGAGEVPEVEALVADKAEALVFDRQAGHGLRRVPVPEERRREPSLTPAQVAEVAAAGLAVERRLRAPQDVELCYDTEGRLWLLQARPITTVDELGPAAGNRLVWDNSNIIESYSGVTSPLTFSFIRRAYAIVYHCFAEVMGIDAATVRANRSTFEGMLGLFRGQVYYNLGNWYRLVRLFPGYDYNRRFMESMMGVREPLEDDADAEPAGRWRRWTVELPALVRLTARVAWRFLRIERIVGGFEAHFRERYRRWSALDLTAMEPHELLALYRRMEDELLWEWKAPIVNDFYVMVSYGALKHLCRAWCGDDTGSLQNDLLCGQGDIESTAPTRRLLELAADARRDPPLAALLAAEPPAELVARVPADPRFAAFAAGVADYLERWGFRGMDELKLEEPSLKERPAFLYQVLANYAAMPDDAFAAARAGEEREQRVRAEAEARARAALGRGGWPGRGLMRRALFRRVLAAARRGVRNRENLRFARTRIYGLLRELVNAVGARFAAAGILDDARDVYLLALDEVWDYVRGTAVSVDLRGLAEARRREWAAYREDAAAMPDDRFVTYGLPYHRNRFKARRRAGTAAAAAAGGAALAGIPCSPGVVEGEVKVVRSPQDDLRLAGEILVAGRTDPGWVPLYPSVSGLLIERGSILSHSAIVAREMGIPTIVSIPGLLDRLASGDRVRMDGSAGTVEVLDEE